jgi:hypothetical protein
LPHLEEADDDGEGHEEVDDGVGDIDDEDGDEVKVLLVDQGEVEDESDGEGHQGKQPCKDTMNTNLQKIQVSMETRSTGFALKARRGKKDKRKKAFRPRCVLYFPLYYSFTGTRSH